MENLFDNASRVMTVISFITFMGIVAWAYARRNQAGFAQAAQLPFADEEKDHV
ncbi:cytochrome C oxidase Cbb3 [Massilia sp. Root351]|jgi:cytochrome c oxidase cbb3-type subunit 4|uniref:cbb3-type cytochrome oxidase subunit 3 n=1 Tax=Massilia sp. Root351 TaxID=1736522 RepID=UPI00070C2C5A|nr:CcoQ/FixQ family Cbb3-type cytochrome c oxidase assembly chaperone [Massilia sp. Root351]KQV90010.1 cytochrome C oxidase Cbb3 [Massilia sp. Root351]